jgi:Ca2+-binding EF-hand superfamily protein
LNDENLVDLFLIHTAMDREGEGLVDSSDFFDKYLEIRPNLMTESVLKLVDNKKLGMITFGEYVDIICTFCCFEIAEIIKFVFYTLDAEKIGKVDKNEVKHFVYDMYYHEVTSNIHEGLSWLDDNDRGDGRFGYSDIWTMHIKYPNLFYPAFRLQVNMIAKTFKEEWWNMKKATLIDTKEERRL